jgi:hypothetical protein
MPKGPQVLPIDPSKLKFGGAVAESMFQLSGQAGDQRPHLRRGRIEGRLRIRIRREDVEGARQLARIVTEGQPVSG